MTKIKIAGAGISGLTCAIVLAKSGIKTEIHERSNKVGSRFHGDLQGLENFSRELDILEEIKSYGVCTDFPCEPVTDNMQLWTSNHKVRLSSHKPSYYIVRRGSENNTLDYHLYNQALSTNKIDIKFNSEVKSPEEVDVIATGPVYNDPNLDGLAGGFIFQTDLKNCGVLLLNDNFAPDGYSYFLVMNGTGVAVSVICKDYQNLNTYSKKTFEYFKKNIQFKIKGKTKPFAGLGNMFIRKKFNRIAIGEAGGLQDFMAGFGMRFAIQSGFLAAKSIIENKDYNNLIKQEIHPYIKASIVNRFLYKPFQDFAYNSSVKLIPDKENIRKQVQRLYHPQWWHKALYPLAKFFLKPNIKDPLQ